MDAAVAQNIFLPQLHLPFQHQGHLGHRLAGPEDHLVFGKAALGCLQALQHGGQLVGGDIPEQLAGGDNGGIVGHTKAPFGFCCKKRRGQGRGAGAEG